MSSFALVIGAVFALIAAPLSEGAATAAHSKSRVSPVCSSAVSAWKSTSVCATFKGGICDTLPTCTGLCPFLGGTESGGCNFVDGGELTTTLADYVTNAQLVTTLVDYVKDTELTETLVAYVKDEELTNTLAGYVKEQRLSNYVTRQEYTGGSSNYVTINQLDNIVSNLRQEIQVLRSTVSACRC